MEKLNKPVVVHVIDSLGRGGAETLLADTIKDESYSYSYSIVLVTLTPENDFPSIHKSCLAFHCLDYKGYGDFFRVVHALRKIIEHYNPKLLRAQLFWSTVIARVANTKKIPFVFSVHATVNEDPIAFYKKYFLVIVDKLTYRRSQQMIGVTNAVIESFKKVHPRHGKLHLLYNYVNDIFFVQNISEKYKPGTQLKLVAVNNIRLIKNIPFLIEAMSLLQDIDVKLEIFGDGVLLTEMRELVKSKQLNNVVLMGPKRNIETILPDYHVFVSASQVEGFGIAVVEAMAVGLPVVVSNIKVYQEVCKDNALYFNLSSVDGFCTHIRNIYLGKEDINLIGEKGREYAHANFSKKQYVQKLMSIYDAVALS